MARREVAAVRETRAQILTCAVDLASLGGLQSLTVGGLADRVGMSKSGLIRHFGSKEQLQLATLDSAIRTFTAEVWSPVADQPVGLTRLRALVAAWLSYVEREVFPGGCFLSAASLEFDDRPGPIRDAIAAAMRRWLLLLADDAEAARVAGELVASTDADLVAFQVNAALMAANWGYRLMRDPNVFEQARRAADRVLAC